MTNYKPRDLAFLTLRVLRMTQQPVPRKCPSWDESRLLVFGAERQPWFPQLLDELASWYETVNQSLSPELQYAIPDYLRDRVKGGTGNESP